ncbi:hypothetical protein GX411_02420 [Candidatus Fermentibacteria bacterium]|nr:hypothetical protein [Candidatus Fermentibacteria bacterium]
MDHSVLILDYSTDRASGPLIRGWIPGGIGVLIHRPADEKAMPDPRGFTRVIHTGSALSICDDAPFQAEAERFILEASSAGVPQMGICYGHQLLIRSIVGREAVRRSPEGVEAGWLEVCFSPLACRLVGMPRRARLFQFHFDEAVTLPEGAVVLAWSGHTIVQSFLDTERRLFGCQFHPEFDKQRGDAQFLAERAKLAGCGLDADEVVAGSPDPPADGRFFDFFLRHPWEGR